MDQELLSETFVELTDTMVAGFDVIDFLHVLTDRSVRLLDVSAAGLLLADPRGELRVVAASSQAARLLELFQLQNDQGPCLDCFRTGRPVAAADLAVHRAEIDQATGMLTEQLGVGIAEAFIRLRAYAYVNDLRLTDVARDIVARRLRLQPDLDPSAEGGR